MLDALVLLLSLIAVAVFFGIDTIFISIVTARLPEKERNKLRYWRIGIALVMRLCLLVLISWIFKLDQKLFNLFDINFTSKELILIIGGLFLIYKSTKEIYHKSEDATSDLPVKPKNGSFRKMLTEVFILGLVFSIDSIINAVGMVSKLWIMNTAVIVTLGIMFIAAKPISDFISKHPSFKILGLCFFIMIGVSIIAEGLEFKIPKGYIYFLMAFAFLVDILQMKTTKPIKQIR